MQASPSPSTGGKSPAQNDALSEDALILDMVGDDAEQIEEEPEDEESEDSEIEETETTEEVEDETEEEEEEEPENEGQIDFDNLTEEQWETVRKQLRSRAAADIKKLKHENAQLAAQLQNQPQQPAKAQPEPASSPLLDKIETEEDLESRATVLKKSAKSIEAMLDDNEDASPDEVIEHAGKSHTKREWKQGLRNIRDALDEVVPYMRHNFQQRKQWEAAETAYQTAAEKEIPEIADEKTEIGKLHKAMLADPIVQKIRKFVPEFAPQAPYLLAHAVRSMKWGAKPPAKTATAPVTTGTRPKARPPGNPSGVAGAPAVRKDNKAKGKEAAEQRFKNSCSEEDLIAAMAAEL